MPRTGYLLIIVVLCAWVFMPAAAWALEGWYGTVSGGPAWFESDEFVGGVSGPITQEFDNAYGVSTAVGYGFQRFPIRLEGEFTYFRADVVALPGTLTAFQGGDDRHYIGMANVYYDLALGGMFQRLKPYVGLGVGFDVETWGLSLVTPSGVNTAGRYDTEAFFAYQIKAGLAYALTDRLDVLVGYRYFRTQDRSLDSPSQQVPFPHDAQAVNFLEFGLRWDFQPDGG